MLKTFKRLIRGIFSPAQGAILYLHYPCFDGLISGALAWEFLEGNQGWKIEQVRPVNYDLRSGWLSTKLAKPCAVVDFLYHPRAAFWADHHMTSFLTAEARQDFERRREGEDLFYEQEAGSCASLLWKHVASGLGGQERYREMVDWAETIDSGRYASIEEAILGDAPALRINFSLLVRNGQEYCEYLLRHLRRSTLAEVAELPEVRGRWEEVRAKTQAGLQHLREVTRLESDGIAVFEAEAGDEAIFSRYAPYYFFPEARYSIGMVRTAKGASITAMRNPWRDFQSIPLGEIFARHGGGGHQRVGSVFLAGERAADGGQVLSDLLREMRAETALSVPTIEGATV